jgi:hypothetical protein
MINAIVQSDDGMASLGVLVKPEGVGMGFGGETLVKGGADDIGVVVVLGELLADLKKLLLGAGHQ